MPFEEIDIDHDEPAAQYVESLNEGNRSVPMVVFDDGTILKQPDLEQVAEKLGLI